MLSTSNPAPRARHVSARDVEELRQDAKLFFDWTPAKQPVPMLSSAVSLPGSFFEQRCLHSPASSGSLDVDAGSRPVVAQHTKARPTAGFTDEHRLCVAMIVLAFGFR
jgi:hypothetical protein